MKKLFKILLILVTFCALIVLVVMTTSRNNNRVCEQISIYIDYQNGDHLITAQEVRKMLQNEMDTLEGMPMKEIDLLAMKNMIMSIPTAEDVSVSSQIGGEIVIKIKQRVPIARVMDEAGKNFYLDAAGHGFAVHNKYSSHQMIINGSIGKIEFEDKVFLIDTLNNKELDHACQVAQIIVADPFWESQIVQLFFNDQKEIEAIPRIGDFTILLGDANRINEKLDYLSAFFKQGLSTVGWDTYRTIDLSFENQIICTKR